MTIIEADASPEKGLFLEMFTRDLSLEDCILDLVDNSIDSLIGSRNIKLADSLGPFVGDGAKEEAAKKTLEPARIDITIDAKKLRLSDNCGGISVKDATEEVFRFGHSKGASMGQLGVYGIGLKRAIFKIGKLITIESRTTNDGFKMVIPVDDWAKERSWKLPLEVIDRAPDATTAGTCITIETYTPEVAERLKSGTFEGHLKEMIGRTYCLFLNRFVEVCLNGHKVEPIPIPMGRSDDVNVAKEEFVENDVTVIMYSGLAARGSDGEWQATDAGWYVACNGRLVVAADKTETTGWGIGLPTYQPKYRGFVGLVFFLSENPLALPWTTMKRGLNQESLVYQRTRAKMATIGRPVLSFLNDLYSSEETERLPQREVAQAIRPVDVRELTAQPMNTFEIKKRPPGEATVRVQYDAKQVEVNRIKRCIAKSTWSAARIGKYTFDHFLKTECPE